MKTYKNSTCITGELHHLEAFTKDLEKIGYTKYNNRALLDEFIVINPLHVNDGNGKFGWYGNYSETLKAFNLPESWKSALEYVSELEQLSLEVGDYAILRNEDGAHHNTFIAKLEDKNKGTNGQCGSKVLFSIKGKGGRDNNYWCITEKSIERLATPQEIESHLIAEASKQGFVIGAKVKFKDTTSNIIQKIELYNPKKHGSISTEQYAEKEKYFLVVDDYPFTVPLPQCTLLPSHPEIKVTVEGREYTAKFENWGISFNDCAKFDKREIIKLYKCIIDVNFDDEQTNTNRSVLSVKWGKAEFTIDQLKQMSNYYENK